MNTLLDDLNCKHASSDTRVTVSLTCVVESTNTLTENGQTTRFSTGRRYQESNFVKCCIITRNMCAVFTVYRLLGLNSCAVANVPTSNIIHELNVRSLAVST